MFHLRKVLSLGEKRERSFSRIFVGLFSFIGIVFILIGIGVAICMMFIYYAYVLWFCNWGSKVGLSKN